jgi:2-dehydro-3-deoxyphosphogluconate aldolase / (4S)-4-hydroxy-2-oxoglutarate aldolase
MLEADLRAARVIPVVTFDRLADALPLAWLLRDVGIRLIEVALRSPQALPAIRAIRAAGVDIGVAAGTVRAPADFDAALAAGAQFCVSPAATPALVAAARALGVAWLPGASTPSEVLALVEAGFTAQKLFPASLPLLQALRGPFSEVAFCPTGGIDAGNARSYLGEPNVLAVAGSWIAPRKMIAAQRWPEIRQRARAVLAAAN